MKVAFLSESETDEAAVRVLVEGLLGEACEESVPKLPLIGRGWQGTILSVPGALYRLHYETDVEAIVVTLDSDKSPVPQKGHGSSPCAEATCRLCQVRRAINDTKRMLKPRQGRGPVKTAVGVAVPAIEAWCLVGKGQRVTETAWMLGLQTSKFPYTEIELKRRIYGTERLVQALKTQRAVEEAQRIVRDGKLPELELLFPGGFGAIADDVRGWRDASK